MSIVRAFVAVALLSSLAGCLAAPRIVDPGSDRYKQARAQRFDPYPENDMGPAVVGGRPREFRDPPPEVLRVQPRKPSPYDFTPPPAGQPL